MHKGCGNGSMIVFTPDGRGKIVNDKSCIEQVQQIMETTPGFGIVHDRGAHVLDVDVSVGSPWNVTAKSTPQGPTTSNTNHLQSTDSMFQWTRYLHRQFNRNDKERPLLTTSDREYFSG